MRLLDIVDVGEAFVYQFGGGPENYPHWIRYRAVGPDGNHDVRIGFTTRPVYGRERKRVVVWIDGEPQAEFLGTDDLEYSGDVLSEVRVAGDVGERMCRYPEEPIAERYVGLPAVGLPTRVTGPGVRNAWAIVANIADHRILFALAALRRLERDR